MQGKMTITTISAARATATFFGVLAGLGGMTHGIGEILQGNVAASGNWVKSWTIGPIATNLGGEPTFTILPNLLVMGILTIIVSLVVVAWSAAQVQKKNGGIILMLLAVVLALTGGGMAPPIAGILAGIAGTGINARYNWWRNHLPSPVQRLLAALWPWIFGVFAINGVFLVIGSVVLVYLFGLNNPDLFTTSFLVSIGAFLLTILTGIAYDLQAGERGKNRTSAIFSAS